MTERQKYQVVQKYDSFELRKYEPCVIAEVTNSDSYSESTQKSFGSLFRYISKENADAAKISMTAPVIAATDDGLDSRSWKVSFVMPAGSIMENLPTPSSSNVMLRQVNSEDCVALSFRGRADTKLCTQKEELLRLKAQQASLALSHETRVCRFDPPFKPGFLQYNEIVIPLSK